MRRASAPGRTAGTAYKPDGSREFAEEHGIEFHELPGDKP